MAQANTNDTWINGGLGDTNGAGKPTEMQITGRGTKNIQTHNAVVIPASSVFNVSQMQSAIGYDQIAVGYRSDANHSSACYFVWYETATSSSPIGADTVAATGSRQYGIARTGVKAPYFKISLDNGDTSPHTMSSLVTLFG